MAAASSAPRHEVLPRAAQVEAHGVRLVRVVAPQQVQREQHGHQREDDAGQLVGEVEPGPVGGDRGVHRRGLRPEGLGAGQLVDDAKERPDRRGAEGDTEDEPGLGEVPAPHADRVCRRGRPDVRWGLEPMLGVSDHSWAGHRGAWGAARRQVCAGGAARRGRRGGRRGVLAQPSGCRPPAGPRSSAPRCPSSSAACTSPGERHAVRHAGASSGRCRAYHGRPWT